jgi:pimeloyl-ACP methyl ester carboxylesterase
MRRWITWTLIVGGGLLVLAALGGAAYQWLATRRELAAHPPPGRLVDIGGHRLHIWCTGAGTPTVILESGLGGSSVDWGSVQPEVARFTRVCSYDRAGMGYSDPGPSPRTSGRIARELAQLLDRSGVTEGVILVGASLGGFAVRILASEDEERVAGLVLVDASHENQQLDVPSLAPFVPFLSSTGVFRISGVSFGQRPESLAPSVREYARATRFRATTYRAAADEVMNVRESAEEVRSTRRKLSAPVVVLTAGLDPDSAWRDLQRDLTTLSKRGCQIVAERSGHVIPLSQPEAVVDAIRVTVAAARDGQAALCSPPR